MLGLLLWELGKLWSLLWEVGHGSKLGLQEAGLHGHLRLSEGLRAWEGARHLLAKNERIMSSLLLEVLIGRTSKA